MQTTTTPDPFARARKIADAVLYEGYVLYPYRASSAKNRLRWQFGVLAPRTFSEADGSEAWWCRTECLLEDTGKASFTGKVRFLQTVRRDIEAWHEGKFRSVDALDASGRPWMSWDEAIEKEFEFHWNGESELSIPFTMDGDSESESIYDKEGALIGRAVRTRKPVRGEIVILAARSVDYLGLAKLTIRVENRTEFQAAGKTRNDALVYSLIGAHLLLSASDGAFVSLIDPPDSAKGLADSCKSERAFPVLAGEEGERTLLLASPIILYDHPSIAPESPGDLFDGCEIDEILTLRTMTLTDDEKREARATDPRAARLIDRVDAMPQEILDKLHGAIRSLKPSLPAGVQTAASAQLMIGDKVVKKGSLVKMKPGGRRSDAQDMFLVGRVALVERIMSDVDDNDYLVLTPIDDPAAEINRAHGRHLYFYPDEVETME